MVAAEWWLVTRRSGANLAEIWESTVCISMLVFPTHSAERAGEEAAGCVGEEPAADGRGSQFCSGQGSDLDMSEESSEYDSWLQSWGWGAYVNAENLEVELVGAWKEMGEPAWKRACPFTGQELGLVSSPDNDAPPTIDQHWRDTSATAWIASNRLKQQRQWCLWWVLLEYPETCTLPSSVLASGPAAPHACV